MRSLVQILALFILSLPLVVSGTPTPFYTYSEGRITNPRGIEVSYQPDPIDWRALTFQFAYIKATHGTTFVQPSFGSNYAGAGNNSLIHGAYHVPRLGDSTGAVQAEFFLANGGVWSGDGITLPGAIKLTDYDCDLSQGETVNWVQDFSNTYRAATGRLPVIYTSVYWWVSCTGNSDALSGNPLWIAVRGAKAGPLPTSWSRNLMFSEYAGGEHSYDLNYFNGDRDGLQRFARGG